MIKRTGETESSYSDDKSNLLGRMSYRQVPVHCPKGGGGAEKKTALAVQATRESSRDAIFQLFHLHIF